MQITTKTLKEIGNRLRKIREEKRMSQTEVALAMKMVPTQYNKVENGNVNPGLETMVKISEALDVSLDVIVYGKQRYVSKENQEVVIPDAELAQKMTVISGLSPEDKFIANQLVDLILTKKTLKDLTSTLHKKFPR